MTQRIVAHPFLGIFDGADPNASTSRRDSSTTPLQALYLMNDAFVHEQAKKFAALVEGGSSDDAARIVRAYAMALGRPPADEERDAALRHVQAAGWESLARVLFRLNELVYVN